MERDKPLISILMAVYEPRMDWLREQLLSLNAQTYGNLCLYVRDDGSPTVTIGEITALVRECVTAFPWKISLNERNLGSSVTFERLTREAEGEYFAYCDQDDVWCPEKLETLEKELVGARALLACSDMYVMDGDGKTVADSITKVRRHHVFRSGSRLAEGLLFKNFVTGCTMLVKASAAKAAVPFCPYMVHDHYLALWCAEHGSIISVPKPLIRYRIHGGNQTGMMAGVTDKESYGRIRIDEALERMLWLRANFNCGEPLRGAMDEGVVWLRARQSNWNRRGGAGTVWKYRRLGPLVSTAEILLRRCPERLFKKAIAAARQNLV